MEKQGNSQLELFSQGSDSQGLKPNESNPFLARIWNYEKTILIILAILVTGIVAFSLGVEKGKSQPAARKEAAVQGTFTIQIGSFKTKANALKEAELIKKRGLSTILFSKNGYFILCAGNFPSKESAANSLGELNKRYGNCQLRRL